MDPLWVFPYGWGESVKPRAWIRYHPIRNVKREDSMATYDCTFDGCAEPNPGKMGCGWTINGVGDGYAAGHGTNNKAEYLALIRLLEVLKTQVQLGDEITIAGDSELVINQLAGEYRCKSVGLYPLKAESTALIGEIKRIAGNRMALRWHPREQNEAADAESLRAIGVDPEARKRAYSAEEGYGTLTDAAREVGISAIMVGRVLYNLGYRADGKPTQKAWDEEIVSQHYPNSWTPYPVIDWHRAKVVELVLTATPEQTQKAEKPKVERTRMVALDGNTYPHREAIRMAGGKWDPMRKIWRVPEAVHHILAAQIRVAG